MLRAGGVGKLARGVGRTKLSAVKRALFVAGIAIVISATAIYAFRWAIVNAAIRREFSGVSRISTKELAEWLNDKSQAAPLLLDARTRAEYEVSHLPGAEYAGSDTKLQVPDEPKDRPIVTYCSVGYRSAKFARQLQAVSYTNVRNLEGSIFKWRMRADRWCATAIASRRCIRSAAPGACCWRSSIARV